MAKEKGMFSRFFQREGYMDSLKKIDEDLKKAVEGLEKLKKDCVEKHKLVLAFVFNYDHKGGKVKELKEEVKAIKERIKKDKRIGHRVEVYCGKIIAIIDLLLNERAKKKPKWYEGGYINAKLLGFVKKHIEAEKDDIKKRLKENIKKQEGFFDKSVPEIRVNIKDFIVLLREEVQLLEPEESWLKETEAHIEGKLDSNVVWKRIQVLRMAGFKVDKYRTETMLLVRHWGELEQIFKRISQYKYYDLGAVLNYWAKEKIILPKYLDSLILILCKFLKNDNDLHLFLQSSLSTFGLPSLVKGGLFDDPSLSLSVLIADLDEIEKLQCAISVFEIAFPVLSKNGLFKSFRIFRKVKRDLLYISMGASGLNTLCHFQDIGKVYLLNPSSWKSTSRFLINISKEPLDVNKNFFYFVFPAIVKSGLIRSWDKIVKDLEIYIGGAFGYEFSRIIGIAGDNNLLNIETWDKLMPAIEEIALECISDEKYILYLLKKYLKGDIKLRKIKELIRKKYKFEAALKKRIKGGPKFYITSLNDWLNLKEIEMILNGKLFTVYYHGARWKNMDSMIEHGLMGLYKLNFKILISCFLKNKDKQFITKDVDKIIKTRTKSMEPATGALTTPAHFEVKTTDIFGKKEKLTGKDIARRLSKLKDFLFLRDRGGRENILYGNKWNTYFKNKRDPWVTCLFQDKYFRWSASYSNAGVVFEIKPSCYTSIMRPSEQAPVVREEGRVIDEYVSDKIIDIKSWVCAIYVAAAAAQYKEVYDDFTHNIHKVAYIAIDDTKKLLEKHGITVRTENMSPEEVQKTGAVWVLTYEDQKARIKQIRQELQSILDKARGKVKEPVKVMEKAA